MDERRTRALLAPQVVAAVAAASAVFVLSPLAPWPFMLVALATALVASQRPLLVGRHGSIWVAAPTFDLVTLTALFTYGPAPAILLRVAAGLAADAGQRKRIWQLVGNASHSVLATAAAGVVAEWLGVGRGGPIHMSPSHVGALFVVAATRWLISQTLVSASLATARASSFRDEFWDGAREDAGAQTSLACLAMLVVAASHESGSLLPLAMVPVLLAASASVAFWRRDFAALHDSLTELGNRRLLEVVAPGELPDGTSLILVDGNRVKAVNDTLGHQAGDALIVGFAQRILTHTPPGATLARLGGDEFALLLPPQAVSNTASFKKQLREILSDQYDVGSSAPFFASASVGIATCPTHGSSLSELLSVADQDMYQDKVRTD